MISELNAFSNIRSREQCRSIFYEDTHYDDFMSRRAVVVVVVLLASTADTMMTITIVLMIHGTWTSILSLIGNIELRYKGE